METILKARHKQAYAEESYWITLNPVLLKGEVCYSSDKNNMFKVGDGIKHWDALEYATAVPDTHRHNADTLPAASATVSGVTKLTDSISSTSTTTAATPNALKQAYDKSTTAIAEEVNRAKQAESLKAPTLNPAFTGTPTAPTAAAGTNTTQLATTAFVQAALESGIAHKDVPRSNTSSAVSPSHGGTFTAIKSVSSDAKGHVTGVDTETVTLPSYDIGTSTTAGLVKSGGDVTIGTDGKMTVKSGTVTTAGKLATPRSIGLTGAVNAASANFDGSANVSIQVLSVNAGNLMQNAGDVLILDGNF